MCLVPCFIRMVHLYATRHGFSSTSFARVTAKLMCLATKAGVPNNKDCNTLSVPMEASRYRLGSTWSPSAQWHICHYRMIKAWTIFLLWQPYLLCDMTITWNVVWKYVYSAPSHMVHIGDLIWPASWDSSVGRAVDLHVRGPGFNTHWLLTQPSIPQWVGKMSTSSESKWRNNVYSKKITTPRGSLMLPGSWDGRSGSPSLRNVTMLGLSWVIIMLSSFGMA